jgi:hypothetical protein
MRGKAIKTVRGKRGKVVVQMWEERGREKAHHERKSSVIPSKRKRTREKKKQMIQGGSKEVEKSQHRSKSCWNKE